MVRNLGLLLHDGGCLFPACGMVVFSALLLRCEEAGQNYLLGTASLQRSLTLLKPRLCLNSTAWLCDSLDYKMILGLDIWIFRPTPPTQLSIQSRTHRPPNTTIPTTLSSTLPIHDRAFSVWRKPPRKMAQIL